VDDGRDLLERREVLAWHVLGRQHAAGQQVGDVLHLGGDSVSAEHQLHGLPATLASDALVATLDGADQTRRHP
jgi:hypothetical protein